MATTSRSQTSATTPITSPDCSPARASTSRRGCSGRRPERNRHGRRSCWRFDGRDGRRASPARRAVEGPSLHRHRVRRQPVPHPDAADRHRKLGLWLPPGGQRLSRDAAIREVLEETGVTPRLLRRPGHPARPRGLRTPRPEVRAEAVSRSPACGPRGPDRRWRGHRGRLPACPPRRAGPLRRRRDPAPGLCRTARPDWPRHPR